MKQYKILLIIFILAICMFPLQAQKPPKDFVFFNDSTLVSKYEVRNNEYRQFLYTFTDHPTLYIPVSDIPDGYYPDSSQWVKAYGGEYKEELAEYYFHSPSYDNYPLVNISKKAMEAYCEWITKEYNNNPDRKFSKVKIRLPKEREWMAFAAAKPGLSLPWVERVPYNIGKKNEIIPLANLKAYDFSDGSYNYTYDNSRFPARTGFYPSNDLGVYEVIGNVAEMTDSGVIKGGSWDNTVEESKIHKEQTYEIPHPCVGFRVVMDIVSE